MDSEKNRKGNITFIIFTYNDGYRVEYSIRNLKPFGEVIVSDQESTDNTVEIANKLSVRVASRKATGKPFIETQELLDTVEGLATNDWIYWGFVDNILPKTLLEKMVKISHQDKYKHVFIPIYTYLWGDTKNVYVKAAYGCFWKKGMMDFRQNRIHNMGKFLGKKEEELRLPMKPKYAMRHFSLYDMNKFLSSHWRYAQTEAEQKYRDGKRLGFVYLFGSMARYFWIFWGGIKAGTRGLLVSLLYSFFRLMMCVRLYELEHGWTLESIEAEYAKEKKKLVEEIEAK